METTHTIKLVATPDSKVQAVPDASSLYIRVHDRLVFVSDDGVAEVDFEPSVFSPSTFGPSTPYLQAVKTGKFVGHCKITLPSGKTIGWGAADAGSGTSGEVIDGTGRSRDLP